MYDTIFFSVEDNKQYRNNEISFYLYEIKKAFGSLAKLIQ